MHHKQIFLARFGVPILALLGGSAADAALLGITTTQPDVGFSSAVDYNAPICQKSAGGNGSAATDICGTVINLPGNNNDGTYNGALVTAGTLTITDLNTIMSYSDDAVGGTNSLADFNGDFTLTAYFDASGVFGQTIDDAAAVLKTSNLSLTYLNLDAGGPNPAVTGLPGTSGTLIAANLGAFGFNGTGNGGAFDFGVSGIYGGLVTGGFWAGLSSYSGTTAGVTIGTGIPAGAWTTSNLFLHDWNSSTTGNTVDTMSQFTVVPVPAAVWLFGTGLAALAGFARRRRVVGA
jgi:hypothetical protein